MKSRFDGPMQDKDTRLAPARAVRGCLVGHAVGDAIGLPREGLSRRRARRMFGDGSLEHRLFAGRGMVSDDTDHHAMVAQALLASRGDPARFARSLAWRLRGWLLGLPAGIGYATLRAILKLWLGASPARSGVRSAGNGAAMRAPVLGVCLGASPARLDAFVHAATCLTHTDARAEQGARIIARAAWRAAVTPPEARHTLAAAVMADALEIATAADLRAALETAAEALRQGHTPTELADDLGLQRGVTGFVVHTVPVALGCWLAHVDDFRGAVESVVHLGGDTDTTAAIVGALAGAHLGVDAIPSSWRERLVDWPRSLTWLDALAGDLAGADLSARQWALRPRALFWPGLLVRNVWFFAVVMVHGLRRLLPPY